MTNSQQHTSPPTPSNHEGELLYGMEFLPDGKVWDWFDQVEDVTGLPIDRHTGRVIGEGPLNLGYDPNTFSWNDAEVGPTGPEVSPVTVARHAGAVSIGSARQPLQ